MSAPSYPLRPFGIVLTALASILTVAAAPAGRAAELKNAGYDRAVKARNLFGLTWQPSREAALKKAAPTSAKDQPKPVFLLQMLGDLAGFT